METRVLSHDAQITPQEYRRLRRHPIYVILNDLRSAFNVGAIFRTADAARIEKLMLCGYTAYPPHRKLDKTSMGTIPYVQWQHYHHVRDAITELQMRNIPVYAVEVARGSASLFNFDISSPAGFVFGNEALGVCAEALELADGVLEIPLFGFKNSLNVATACGIVLFQAIRQYPSKIKPIQIYRM